MKEEMYTVYRDDYFGCTFGSKKECSNFEKFCSNIKVYPVEWDTDLTEGKYSLCHTGDYVLYCGSLELEDMILPVIKYFMSEAKGCEYGVVGGIFKNNNVLPRWRVLEPCSLGEQQAKLSENNIFGVITDEDMYIPSEISSLDFVKDVILKVYKKSSGGFYERYKIWKDSKR